MSSYKDITTFSTSMLVKSLDTLEISAGEDNGDWGAQLVKSWVVVYLFSNLGLVSWRWFRGHLGDKG